MNRRALWLAASLGVLFSGPAMAGGKPDKCVDPRVRMTIATFIGDFGIYGDFVNTIKKDGDNTVYTVYEDETRFSIRFQVCNGSMDLILNSTNSTRRLWWNWGDRPVLCTDAASCLSTPPAWVSGAQFARDSYLNINQAYAVPEGQSITTWMSGLFTADDRGNYGIRFRNPNANYYNDFPNGNLSIINIPYNTALVRVTRTGEYTWTVEAVPDPNQPPGGPTDVPLATLFAGTMNAGQYNMPFRITLELMNP